MSFMRSLFVDNPMMVEWQMAKRKMKPQNWKTQGAISFSIILILLTGGIYFLATAAPFFDPAWLFVPEVAVLMLAIPLTLSPVVAGERQVRSLETLYAAPVTPGQIVTGKMLRGVFAAGATVGTFTVLMMFTAFVRAVNPLTNRFSETNLGFWVYPLCLFVVFATTVFNVGLGMWISSISKSTGSSLLASVTAMVVIWIFIPVLFVPIVSAGDTSTTEALFAMHPIGGTINFLSHTHTALEARDILAMAGPVFWTAGGLVLLALAGDRLTKERKKGVETR